MHLSVTTRVSIAAAIALGAAACGGTVAGSPTDGGGSSDSPVSQEGGPVPEGGSADTGPTPHDGGPGPHDGGPTPVPDAGDTCASPGVQCTTPPPAPTGTTSPPPPTAHDYAIHQLYVGDTDRTGVTSSDAWRAFGYNLDGLVTTQSSTDVCTLTPGASKTTQVDGNGGIDNSFGENILPIIVTISGSDFSTKVDATIVSGAFTDLVYTVGFDDTAGNTTSATGLTGVALGGGNYALLHNGVAPTWNLTTHWPIRPETLNGCPNGVCPAGTDPIANATVKFPSAYQKDGTWVNGSPASLITISLGLGGQTLPLQVRSATVTFDPKAPGSVTNGTIAGVLATNELIAGLQSVAGSISTSLCSGSAFNSIAQQIQQGSDIIVDPTSGAVSNKPGTACNAISIGLGFEGVEIAVPTAADVAGPTPVAPSPCGDQ